MIIKEKAFESFTWIDIENANKNYTFWLNYLPIWYFIKQTPFSKYGKWEYYFVKNSISILFL